VEPHRECYYYRKFQFRTHKYYPSDVSSRHWMQKAGRLAPLQNWNINVIFRVSLICNKQESNTCNGSSNRLCSQQFVSLPIPRADLYNREDYCGINRRESISVFAQMWYMCLLWRGSTSQSAWIKRLCGCALFLQGAVLDVSKQGSSHSID
jgi:hypothetical protein